MVATVHARKSFIMIHLDIRTHDIPKSKLGYLCLCFASRAIFALFFSCVISWIDLLLRLILILIRKLQDTGFFIFFTLVCVHFAFVTLIFYILFLLRKFIIIHHFCPMLDKKMVKFCFAFAPIVVVLLLLLPLNRVKAKCQNLESQK